MDERFRRLMEFMDEEQARQILNSVSEEEINEACDWIWDEVVTPHLVDIRERARSDDSPKAVREEFKSLSEDEREEMFYEALHGLIRALVLCREDAVTGFHELKSMLRDPVVQESLLVVFENEEHIDPEYSDHLKEFAAEHVHAVGVMALPEMYDENDRQEIRQRIGLDIQR